MTMNPTWRILLAGLLLSSGAVRAQEDASSSGPEAVPTLRARLLEFAGALANGGFRLRDSHWSGRLEPGSPRRLAVNLFAGNQYWFGAAVEAPEERPVITLYDPQGEVVPVLAHDAPGLAAAGVTAAATGRYVVEVRTTRGPATDFCFIYLFK
jgi:hypothetical protein